MAQVIDTAKFSSDLRRRGIVSNDRKILVSNFIETKESLDFSLPPNCQGFGRIHHFKRDQGSGWPKNPLPIDPASRALGLKRTDTLQVQVFQNAICSWRCWYCFVDFNLLSANPTFSAFKSAEELLDLYLSEKERPGTIDLSGGQPDLVPEWGLWFTQAILAKKLENSIYLWSDDNLSNDYLWRYLSPSEIRGLVKFSNYGRVGCFKGFDAESFAFNTKADPDLFDQQFALMRRLVEAGFDVYGYVTLTTPNERDIEKKVSQFVDRLQERVHPNFPLRTVPLRVSVFTPTRERVGPEQERSLHLQELAVSAWNAELARRYSLDVRERNITEQTLGNR